ncbi:hypothetical protein AB833_02120 [Chromatiales bacterium (ex Bugula neritina AB1)]|nr:hypothetical protein AB833_02120 [Chromatiales bacterium (ex Bugula neritina AB1)]
MIRKAEFSDCQNLAALSLQVWLHTYATKGLRTGISRYILSTYTENHFQKLLDSSSRNIWLYLKEDHLVAFIAIDLDSAFHGNCNGYEITTLYVSEHFHRQGIGEELLNHVTTQLGLPCWLSTWNKNSQASDFYHKQGFKQIGILNFHLDGELHENYVFSKNNL